MQPARRTTRRTITVLATLALAAAGATAVALTATPSQAATCNGYVALTFDDGPSSGSTPALLNALKQNGLRATLFNEGQYAAQYPSQVAAEAAAGMWIGNHSYTHPHMTSLSQSQMDSEISRTQQAISSAGGGTPKLFRPPYGESNSTLQAVEANYGLRQITWDVDSQDWNNASTAAIVQANNQLQNGQIILMHEWAANTLAAIPQIAQNLANRGMCAGMISPSTGRAVAPDGTNPTTQPPTSRPPTTRPPTSAPPTSPPPTGTGACRVSSSVNAWNNGLTENLTITNTGTGTISSWKLVFTLPSGQTITSGWNATYSPSSGQVTATNMSWNSSIPPNASTTIGFQATHTGNTAKPASFTLNGATCTTA